LIAVLVAAVVYWDVWTGKLIEWGGQFLEFIGLFSLVDDVLAVWDKLPQWWAAFKKWIGSVDVFAFVGDSIDWLIEKINLIPGINIGVGDAPKPVAAPDSLKQNSANFVPGGGVMNAISNANTNNSRSVGDITVVNHGNAMSGQTFANELEWAAG